MKHLLSLITATLFFITGYSQTPNLDTIQVTDSDGSGRMINCPLEGSAENVAGKTEQLEWTGNPKKNRYDIPEATTVQQMNIEDLIAPDAIKSKFVEGTPVEVTAYVDTVKRGDAESCNCKTKDVTYEDTHIELTPNNRETGKKFRMIVEITPRLREEMKSKGEDWSTATLKRKFLHKTVTIQGWLFYDAIHEMQSFAINPNNPIKTGSQADWRASCWEIHPITAIH